MKYFLHNHEQEADENRKRITKKTLEQFKAVLDNYPNKGATLYTQALKDMKADLDYKLRTGGLFFRD